QSGEGFAVPPFLTRIARRVLDSTHFMGNSELSKRNAQSPDGPLGTPAYHKSGYEVVRALKQALDRVECSPGQQLEQRQFGCLLGVSKSTIHDWFHGRLVAPIQNFLC